MWSVHRSNLKDNWGNKGVDSGVVAGSKSSTVALRVAGGNEKRTQCLGYNWVNLFLGDIYTGIWPSWLGASRI
jgi:hypothetical protein